VIAAIQCRLAVRLLGAAVRLGAALSLQACENTVENELGLDAPFRVAGGQYFREPMPAPSGGPAVLGAFLTQTRFRVGEQSKSFSGVVAPQATAVAIALDDATGYWVVPTGMPLAETPDAPSFDAPLAFSAAVLPGAHTLQVSAVDLAGAFGEAARVQFELSARPLPAGELVVALSWDTPSDLDLHLITPDGTEVHSGNPNSWRSTAGGSPDPEAWRNGGILDFDSNADCRIDGRQAENVVWTTLPPSGDYAVRVDTPSLCGQAGARWRVDVVFGGAALGAATGSSFATDTRFTHGVGGGVLALRFAVP
jgi:hypothetical protein